MLRLNRLIFSKHLNKISNVWIKSNYYYSSEPPDKALFVRIRSPTDRNTHSIDSTVSDTFFRTTSSELGLFGPHDMRAPLNGNIGLGVEDTERIEAQNLLKIIRSTAAVEKFNNSHQNSLNSVSLDIQSLVSDTDESRCHKFFRILKYQKLFPKDTVCVTESNEVMDCSALDLSSGNIKKFETLFTTSKRENFINGLTAVTVTKKTINDMCGYSEAVELEREEFFENFISEAKNICSQLSKSGFWADFIDPYSGHPFFSEQTNETLFETDDRFLHLGFKIEDLGCCKAIHHNKWGTFVIVGTLFTTAPANSSAIKQIMTQTVSEENKAIF